MASSDAVPRARRRIGSAVQRGKSYTHCQPHREREMQEELWRERLRVVADAQQRRESVARNKKKGGEGERREPEENAAEASGEEREEDAQREREGQVEQDAGGERRRLRETRLGGGDAERAPAGRHEGARRVAVARAEARRHAAHRRGGDRARRHPLCHSLAPHARKRTAPVRALKCSRHACLPVGRARATIRAMSTAPAKVATVLVVEDRHEVLDVLQRALSGSGYEVHTAADGDAGLAMALDLAPDLVVLDIGLPKQNGLNVARELRARGFRAPLLMLTARVSISDRVTGFDAGADDYLVKPFDVDELLARIKALLRRSSMRADDAVLRLGDLAVDTLARVATRAGAPIPLTQKEYALLEYLMRHAGRPVSREQIAEHVWKTEFDPTTNIVDVYINYLRKKLDADGGPQLVHTVRGIGYVMREEEPRAKKDEGRGAKS